MQKTRYLSESIIGDLKNKMVFIRVARQIGKTTLAREIVLIDNYYLCDVLITAGIKLV